MTQWEEDAIKNVINGMSEDEKQLAFMEMIQDESLVNDIRNNYFIELVFTGN